jgi:hypothetical protein
MARRASKPRRLDFQPSSNRQETRIMTSRILPAAIALGLALCAAAMPSQAAVCNNVVFSLTNKSEGPILITRIGYRDLNSSDPSARITENVKDFACPAGAPCETKPQDLGGLTKPRQNHNLTDIQFEHSHEDEFGDWKEPVWSSKNVPVDMLCTDGRTYGRYDVN